MVIGVYFDQSLMLVDDFLDHDQTHAGLIAAHGPCGIEGFEYFGAFAGRDARPAVLDADVNQVGIGIGGDPQPLLRTVGLNHRFNGIVDELLEQDAQAVLGAQNRRQRLHGMPVHLDVVALEARLAEQHHLVQYFVEVDRNDGRLVNLGDAFFHHGHGLFARGLDLLQNPQQAVVLGVALVPEDLLRGPDLVHRHLNLVHGAEQRLPDASHALILDHHGFQGLDMQFLHLPALLGDVGQGQYQIAFRIVLEKSIGVDFFFHKPVAGAGKPAHSLMASGFHPEFPVIEALLGELQLLPQFAHFIAQQLQEEDRRLALVKVGDQRFIQLVVQNDPVLVIEHNHGNRRGIEHGLDQQFLIVHFFLGFVSIGHVAMHADKVRDVLLTVQHGRDGQVGKIAVAEFMPVDQPAVPYPFAVDGMPQVMIDMARRGLVR